MPNPTKPKLNKHLRDIILALQEGHWFELCNSPKPSIHGRYASSEGFGIRVMHRTIIKLQREGILTSRKVFYYGISWLRYELTEAGRALDVSHS
ncbi:hypothetical protein [Enterovibrio coralii]|uniref:Uncharacterized protein n=1 Tax=Enterovibrio coralii TaxID=294935 RepID=A0A135I4F1_9GAMM|nr:hypothetical protein [Enterovibrio coralii]KXF80331.1 hypothetical protein ATN88_10960 [Enterovibrio coralii]